MVKFFTLLVLALPIRRAHAQYNKPEGAATLPTTEPGTAQVLITTGNDLVFFLSGLFAFIGLIQLSIALVYVILSGDSDSKLDAAAEWSRNGVTKLLLSLLLFIIATLAVRFV